MSVPTRTVTGEYETPNGSGGWLPVSGSLRFIPSSTVYDAAGNVVIPPLPIVVPLVSGVLDVDLLVTDDPSTNPTGWVWLVSELIPGGREFSIQIPTSAPSTVDITELTPTVDVEETFAYASLADLLAYGNQLDEIESNAAVVTAAAVIHPFLVMGA